MEELISNIPDTSICGIYSLVDSKGKRYIGSSKNISQRLQQHRNSIRRCLSTGRDAFMNQSMQAAVLAGERFRCEILATFSCDMSTTELQQIERVFIKKFGGVDGTYNLILNRPK